MAEPLLDNPRAFAEKVAEVLGGTAVAEAGLSGFLSSKHDPFLNHLFAGGRVMLREVAEARGGRPAFVWLAEEPARCEIDDSEAERLVAVAMHGMTARIARPMVAGEVPGEIVEVRSAADVDAWHEVYSEVFGEDPRGARRLVPRSWCARSRRGCLVVALVGEGKWHARSYRRCVLRA